MSITEDDVPDILVALLRDLIELNPNVGARERIAKLLNRAVQLGVVGRSPCPAIVVAERYDMGEGLDPLRCDRRKGHDGRHATRWPTADGWTYEWTS